MFSKIKSYVARRLLVSLDLSNFADFGIPSYSQEGEDRLLARMMDRDPSASCYVDVGCNHPFRMSNTAYFYERGWDGVVIDPNPEFRVPFETLRPRDVFVNCGVGKTVSSQTYYRFEESLYNTFDPVSAREIGGKHSKLLSSHEVSVRPLADILDEVWPNGREIRMLSVDCEGMDAEVLQSHDFDRFPTEFVCTEVDRVVDGVEHDPAICFLQEKGYVLLSKLCKSAVLLREDRLSYWGLV